MRMKLRFITGIMGIAVISGIIKGLSSKRDNAKKRREKKPGRKIFSETPEAFLFFKPIYNAPLSKTALITSLTFSPWTPDLAEEEIMRPGFSYLWLS